MALNPYDDPYQDPTQDQYQNPGYVPPAGPLVDTGPGSVPTFRSTTIANPGGSGGGGGFSFLSLLPGLVHLAKHFASFFPHGGGSSTPTNQTPRPTGATGVPLAPLPPPTTPDPAKPKPTTQQQLLGATPELVSLILGLLNKPDDANANNPALAALNASLPQLTAQLNALLQSDVQRRQQSDPLYQAVLRGSMGQLPVWMRGGSSINPPVITPPTIPGQPLTPQV